VGMKKPEWPHRTDKSRTLNVFCIIQAT